MKEKVLYGTMKGAPSYMEEVLCTKPELFELVTEKAEQAGYINIRIAEIDLSEKPNFQKTISKHKF